MSAGGGYDPDFDYKRPSARPLSEICTTYGPKFDTYKGGKRAWIAFSPGEEISTGGGTNARRGILDSFFANNPHEDADEWVAGHLISKSFGGSGNRGENIVPLRRKANADHLNNAEKAVEHYQRIISRYFNQTKVRRYTRALLSLRSTVREGGRQANGAPAQLKCAIDYFVVTRGYLFSGEDDAWTTTVVDGKTVRHWLHVSDIDSICASVENNRREIMAAFRDGTHVYCMGPLDTRVYHVDNT